MLFWRYLTPNVSQIAQKATFLLYVIQLRLVDIVMYIFKTSDKFPSPKHLFRGQRRASNMLLWGYLPLNVSQIARKANVVLYNIQLHQFDRAISIFKTCNKFSGPKYPFRDQRRGLFCYFADICLQMCPKLLRKLNFCYI